MLVGLLQLCAHRLVELVADHGGQQLLVGLTVTDTVGPCDRRRRGRGPEGRMQTAEHGRQKVPLALQSSARRIWLKNAPRSLTTAAGQGVAFSNAVYHWPITRAPCANGCATWMFQEA